MFHINSALYVTTRLVPLRMQKKEPGNPNASSTENSQYSDQVNGIASADGLHAEVFPAKSKCLFLSLMKLNLSRTKIFANSRKGTYNSSLVTPCKVSIPITRTCDADDINDNSNNNNINKEHSNRRLFGTISVSCDGS